MVDFHLYNNTMTGSVINGAHTEQLYDIILPSMQWIYASFVIKVVGILSIIIVSVGLLVYVRVKYKRSKSSDPRVQK